MSKSSRLTASWMALAICFSGPAFAQVAPAADASAEDGQEIIVTGEKTRRTLQETTSSIAVATGKRIEQENLLSLQDIYQRTANVSETYGATGFTIRGIANQGVSGGGDAALATVYLDGAPLPQRALFGAPTGLWDTAQVEILRGPQSTLQGLNALAGAVVLRSRDPSLDRIEADGRLLWSDRDDRTFSAAVGAPLVPGELGLRVSADRHADRGYVRNLTRGGHEDAVKSLTLRGILLWEPSALTGFTARISYTRGRYDGAYQFTYTDISTGDYYDHRTVTTDSPNSSYVRTDIATADLSYEISDRLTINSVTSWNKVRVDSMFDGDGTAEPSAYGSNGGPFRTWTEELRLNYEGDRLKGLIGAFYYNRDQNQYSVSRANVTTPTGTIAGLLQANGFPAATASQIASLYAAALPVIPVDYSGDFPIRVETIALFGDARLHLTDRLSLLGGFRWDHERNSFTVTQNAVFVGTLPDPAAFGDPGTPLNLAVQAINAGVLGLVQQASSSSPAQARTFDAFLPKGGIRMEWTPDLSTAFTVQRGYRSGGSSSNTARSILVAYDPEFTWNYELSLRSVWLDGRLTLNANAFYIDWTRQQVNVNFGLNTYDYNTVNAGKSHLYGFEVESSYRLNPMFDTYLSVGHTKTRFDEFTVAQGTTTTDLSGSEFAFAPHWTVSGGLNARFGGGFTGNLNASWRSSLYSSTGVDQAGSRVGARTIVNARFGYETGHWGLFAYARNLLDAHYMQYRYSGDARAILGAPRVIGGELRVRW